MTNKKAALQNVKGRDTGSVRASISFPSGLYESLEALAKRKKVSLAWVVRDAAELYVASDTTDRSAPHKARSAQ
jgi:metal-responsive CopG/Arc/MetJ family transcriptional regulator